VLNDLPDVEGIIPLVDSCTSDLPAWIALELAEWLEGQDSLPFCDLVRFVSEIAMTLAQLAERDVFHRDIKPANLFIHRGRGAVSDFGLATPWACPPQAGCWWCHIPTAATKYELSVLARRAAASERTARMATSPEDIEPVDDELRPEYDFRSMRGVVRGKYAAKYRERLRVVRLADDVAEAFDDEAAVNNALREYLRTHPSEQSSA